ncbi:MAG: DUF975 family protein [Blautia sp.]|nr:DUF975 family protein [Blautia sp.]
MNSSTRDIKQEARLLLNGKMGTAMLAMIIVTVIQLAGSLVSSYLFVGRDTLSVVLDQVFAFAISLVLSVFSAGLCFLFLNLARGRESSLGDLLYFFRNSPDRVIAAAFVMAVLNFLVTIPYYWYSFTASVGTTLEEQTAWMSTSLLLLILSIVLNTIITVPFAVSFFLLADNPRMGGMASLKESMRMMKGNCIRYLLLQLSFVPWMILSVFTFYIALLWIFPHIQMSETVFFLKLTQAKTKEDPWENSDGGISRKELSSLSYVDGFEVPASNEDQQGQDRRVSGQAPDTDAEREEKDYGY